MAFIVICLAFYSRDDATDYVWVVPVLVAAVCTGVIIFAVHRAGTERWIIRLGLLLAAIFFAINIYEVLLYGLKFCGGDWASYTSVLAFGSRREYCDLAKRVGYWPAFAPALAVLLATTAAVRWGPRPLAIVSIAALLWSLAFVFLPLAFPIP